MQWREMKLELLKESAGLIQREKLVERVLGLGAEVVEHHSDASRIRVVLIDELAHLLDELDLSSFLGQIDVAPTDQQFTDHEEVARSGSSVRVVGASDFSRFRWERVADMGEKLFVGFVETDDWPILIIRFVVEGKNILHTAEELGVLAGESPTR